MKSLLFPILALLIMGLACPLSAGGGAGGQVDTLLEDPQVGLDSLDDYQASLTITFTGTIDGQAVDKIDTLTQSEWPLLQAGFTTIDTVDENGQPLYILSGNVGDAQYEQQGQNGICAVRWGPTAGGPSEFLLVSSLDPVGSARLSGEETVEGISANHYTFNATSLGLSEDVQASGEAWIATEGGYLVKYRLQVTGDVSYFGEGVQGTHRVEYQLSQVNARPQVVYPPGCQPVLTSVPAMDDATDIIRLPGLLDYISNSTLEEISTFYADFFATGSWEQIGDNRFNGEGAVLVFGRADTEEAALVSILSQADGNRVAVSVFTEEVGTGSTTAPETTPQTGSDGSPALRVAGALSILLGMDESQVGLPSYHMEAYHNIPAWEGGAVVQYEDWMVADVQGQNIHFNDRVIDPGGSTTTAEAYLMGEEEYDVENGVLQPEGTSMTGLAWILWPLDPAVILGTGASSAVVAGTETLEGRTAEKYTVNTSGAMAAAAGVGLTVTAVSGQVWVDQQTGALLKAELDYQADVKDPDGNIKGSGSGRLEIIITQIGNVTVILPGQ